MNRLSIREREQVFYDVHGVSDVIEETPQLITTKLSQLTIQLSKLTRENRGGNAAAVAAFREAQAQGPDPLSNVPFLLKFLRADRFEVERAANRVLHYFEEKIKLFPTSKLTKEVITLEEDMNADDMACLESGLCTILPLRDTAGRMILCWSINLRQSGTSLDSRVCELVSIFWHD